MSTNNYSDSSSNSSSSSSSKLGLGVTKIDLAKEDKKVQVALASVIKPDGVGLDLYGVVPLTREMVRSAKLATMQRLKEGRSWEDYDEDETAHRLLNAWLERESYELPWPARLRKAGVPFATFVQQYLYCPHFWVWMEVRAEDMLKREKPCVLSKVTDQAKRGAANQQRLYLEKFDQLPATGKGLEIHLHRDLLPEKNAND